MSENLIPFSFEGTEVRVLDQSGEPWWVLSDVCAVLEHTNSRMAAQRLDEDEKGVSISDTLGGPQEMTVINESGLWSLVLTSRKPAAKRFKKWITSEVIPSIRKTGGYMTASPEETPEEIMLRALTIAKETVDRQKLELEVANKQAKLQAARLEAVTPKARALDVLAGMDGFFGLREAAKECGWPEGKFIQRLHEMRWIFKQEPNRPWQAHSDKLRDGLLAHKTYEQTKPNGEVSLRYQVVVTAKGLTRLAVRLGPVPEGKRAVPFTKAPAITA
ncbi:MAG: phage antirepressor [Acetobacter sp.]|jgi:anti-repressor protein